MLRHLLFPSLLFLLLAVSGCSMVPRRVAVMDFIVATEDPAKYDKLGIAIPEYMTQMLVNYNVACVLERQDIHRFLEEIDADKTDTRSLSRWQKLGQRLSVQYLIAGSVTRLGQNFILSARLFSVETGQLIPGTATTRTCLYEHEIYDRAKVMAADMAYQLQHRGGIVSPGQPSAQPAPAATATSDSGRLPSAAGRQPIPSVQRIQ